VPGCDFLQIEIYEDADGARKEEIADMRGDNVFRNFYKRMEELDRDARGNEFGQDVIGAHDDSALVPNEDMLDANFSGEEGLGRYLDLLEMHQEWQNMDFGKQIPYQDYVQGLETHVDETDKLTKLRSLQYGLYLDKLVSYLSSFYCRIHPLTDIDDVQKKCAQNFENQWQNGGLKGDWCTSVFGTEDAVSIEDFDSVEELEALGGERLKAILASIGLKCGGTPRQRAERLMMVKGKSIDEIDKSLFAKGHSSRPDIKAKATGAEIESLRTIALKEFTLKYMLRLLDREYRATIDRIEKRQAQTYEEFLADMEAEQAEDQPVAFGDEGDDEDEYIYNPLKLPLGWDGKPIPYWLYKLHGLNHEFKCEICGGASYWGRRAFEKHFTEQRHIAGMKALGIPNSKQFFEITSITEAVSLWRNLQEKKSEGFHADVDEEFEDEEGNIFNRKLYIDLQKQGMINH